MNVVRSVISVFLLILAGLSVAGWLWFDRHSVPNVTGARLVLTLCGLASVGGLGLLWTARQPGLRTD